MAVVIRRPGITHEEYVNYIEHIHGYKITCSNPLAIKIMFKIMYMMEYSVQTMITKTELTKFVTMQTQ